MVRDVVVVGASAGGLEPLRRLVSDLPAELDAGVFVGHAFSGDGLLNWQSHEIETALWAAVRAFEERSSDAHGRAAAIRSVLLSFEPVPAQPAPRRRKRRGPHGVRGRRARIARAS